VKLALGLWLALLCPWLIFTPLATGMACDGGCTTGIIVTVYFMWSYPIFVAISYLSRRRWPALIALPLLYFLPFGLLMLARKYNWHYK
jgi:hypothetical protein